MKALPLAAMIRLSSVRVWAKRERILLAVLAVCVPMIVLGIALELESLALLGLLCGIGAALGRLAQLTFMRLRPRSLTAAVEMFDEAQALGDHERPLQALEAYDDVIKRFDGVAKHGQRKVLADAMFEKGLKLYGLGRFQEAREAFDTLIERFGYEQETALRERVVFAMQGKGMALAALGQIEEGLSIFDAVVVRCGESEEVPLRRAVLVALATKGWILELAGRRAEALEAYDAVIARLDDTTKRDIGDFVDEIEERRAKLT